MGKLSAEEIEKIKSFIRGMHRESLCESFEDGYDSIKCVDCESHDDCIEFAVNTSGSYSDTAKLILNHIESQQQEIEQLQVQAVVMREAIRSLPFAYGTEIGPSVCKICSKSHECLSSFSPCCIFEKALSAEAGKELLDKLQLYSKTFDDINGIIYGDKSKSAPEAVQMIKSIIDSVTE